MILPSFLYKFPGISSADSVCRGGDCRVGGVGWKGEEWRREMEGEATNEEGRRLIHFKSSKGGVVCIPFTIPPFLPSPPPLPFPLLFSLLLTTVSMHTIIEYRSITASKERERGENRGETHSKPACLSSPIGGFVFPPVCLHSIRLSSLTSPSSSHLPSLLPPSSPPL